MKKFLIEDASFNITKVCNLTCDGCESFNNYNFKGHMKFADYEHLYTRWSEILDIEIVTIHGGEPFTNPYILNWTSNVKRLWPNADEYYIATNGTLLKNKIDTARKILNQGYYLNITVHDPEMKDDIIEQLHTVLDYKQYYTTKDEHGEVRYYEYGSDQQLALVECTYYFKKSAIDYIKEKTWYMHHSKPEDAWQTCLENDTPCNFFHKGYLYQCHLTALQDDLFLQFSIEPRAVDLLKQYRAGDPFASNKELKRFFKSLNNALPQCTLCPGCDDRHPIFPMPKKKVKF